MMGFLGALKNPWDRPNLCDDNPRSRWVNIGDPPVDVRQVCDSEVDADLGEGTDNVVPRCRLVERP